MRACLYPEVSVIASQSMRTLSRHTIIWNCTEYYHWSAAEQGNEYNIAAEEYPCESDGLWLAEVVPHVLWDVLSDFSCLLSVLIHSNDKEKRRIGDEDEDEDEITFHLRQNEQLPLVSREIVYQLTVLLGKQGP
jgi:hypothetical protein